MTNEGELKKRIRNCLDPLKQEDAVNFFFTAFGSEDSKNECKAELIDDVLDEVKKSFGNLVSMLNKVDETKDTIYISTRFLIDLREEFQRWFGVLE